VTAGLLGMQEPPTKAATNEEKSEILKKTMFLGKPETSSVPCNQEYFNQLPTCSKITEEQLRCHINKLGPYKATRTEETSNVVLKKCVDTLTPYFIQIYRVVFMLQVYLDQWNVITCVLWKPGKPIYDLLKSY
jgi:hypothetical protein